MERSALNWPWKGATEAKREVLEYRGSVVRLRQRWAQAAPSPGLVDDLELDQLSDARWHQLVCISSQSFKAACTIAQISEEKEEDLPPGLKVASPVRNQRVAQPTTLERAPKLPHILGSRGNIIRP